jgi:hypothetical protein
VHVYEHEHVHAERRDLSLKNNGLFPISSHWHPLDSPMSRKNKRFGIRTLRLFHKEMGENGRESESYAGKNVVFFRAGSKLCASDF